MQRLLHFSFSDLLKSRSEIFQPAFKGLPSRSIKYTSLICLVIFLTGCTKDKDFESLKNVSGRYTIAKATFLKSDGVTDSVSFTNFGTFSITDCKANSTKNCPGEYKIQDDPAASIKVNYFRGSEGNILQLGGPPAANAVWDLFGQYYILEETDDSMILKSGSSIVRNGERAGRVILELYKQ